jgi:virulence factor Mce-like protein
MVTQAPKRSSVLAAVAFALSCVGLIIFVWTQFGGTVPLAPQGYRVKALFKETGLLVPNADVRISGVTVGKVASVQAQGVSSLVTMDIEHRYAPIPADTHATLRQKTLLGEAYIGLSPGTGSGPKLPDGGTIAPGHIADTQALDQVLAGFDRPTQHNLQALLSGTYAALAGRGGDLNSAIGNLDPMFTELAAMAGELNSQSGQLRQLISSGSVVLGTLGRRGADLRRLVTAGDQVLGATAARNTALGATVDALPPFLAQLRITLRTLNGTLGLARPTLAAVRPVAPLLTPALSEVIALSGPATDLLHRAPGLLAAAQAAMPSIARFSRAFRPALDAILPAVREITPVIDFVATYRRELVAAMGNLAATVEATAPAAVPGGKTNYLRAISSIGAESIFGQTVREPSSRNNTYFAPGELANLSHGLQAATCANTSHAAQAPGAFGNVPCVVQPPFHWGHGVRTAQFPRLTRAPKP